MRDLEDIDDYANFLVLDKGLPLWQARASAGFMLISRDLKFVVRPYVWVKHGLCRVYFQPWSQNSIRAISFVESIWFCPETEGLKVRINAGGHEDTRELRHFKIYRTWFSGSKTRDAFQEAVSEVAWLKSQLALMS